MSNYQLKNEVRDEYTPIVSNFITKVEEAHKTKTDAAAVATSKKRSSGNDEDNEENDNDEDEDDASDEEENYKTSDDEELNLDLTHTKLNPYTLWKLLESLGYRKTDMDHNGWELDFWITFEKADRQALLISGSGITFTLNLSNKQQ